RRAFAALGLEAAFARAVAAVVQPGVEFGHDSVVPYAPEKARALSAVLDRLPGFVFEAHSTDYQTPEALAALVRDGFAILKVGPGLTFALREALYGLDHIASALDGRPPSLQPAMEALMLARPEHWAKYYPGTPDEQRIQRHFSYFDRIRYYWPAAAEPVARLLARLEGRRLPETLLSQYLPGLAGPTPHALLLAAVQRVLAQYHAATRETAHG
ncbi:class II D-tagatose-bisphosphate aldolase, non-catalytic subunit, partial [Amaricoccus sp.]|uniref:class II D-tagatose-bisphosphate aldolase non-catalytic subunit n=1 Tax=Amaricoccus sp. TaxID=1872485 RepID=UPI0026206580